MVIYRMGVEDDLEENEVLLIKQDEEDGVTWTRQDYILLIMGLFVSFGNGIELYLPGYLLNCTIRYPALAPYILVQSKRSKRFLASASFQTSQ